MEPLPPASVNAGDIVTVLSTAVVGVSLFLNWYPITISAAGVQYLERLLQGVFSSLFGQSLPGSYGTVTGPITLSVTALDHNAGGWRWAMLVLGGIIVVEVLLSIFSTLSSQSTPAWPHGSFVVVLTATNFVLLVVAFFDKPLSGAPPGLWAVGHGVGAYLGVIAGVAALAGAIVYALTSPARRS